MADYSTLGRYALRMATAAQIGLIAMMLVTTVVVPSGGRAPNWTVGLMLSLPLLVLLPGVARGIVSTHIWASFVSMLYFAIAVTNLFLPRRSVFDIVELLLASTLFTTAMLYARWRSRELRTSHQMSRTNEQL